MFGRLTTEQLDGLRALFPYMPPRDARYFAERYVLPPRPRHSRSEE